MDENNCGIYLNNVLNSYFEDLDFSYPECRYFDLENSGVQIYNLLIENHTFSHPMILSKNSPSIFLKDIILKNSILDSQFLEISSGQVLLQIENFSIWNNTCSIEKVTSEQSLLEKGFFNSYYLKVN